MGPSAKFENYQIEKPETKRRYIKILRYVFIKIMIKKVFIKYAIHTYKYSHLKHIVKTTATSPVFSHSALLRVWGRCGAQFKLT